MPQIPDFPHPNLHLQPTFIIPHSLQPQLKYPLPPPLKSCSANLIAIVMMIFALLHLYYLQNFHLLSCLREFALGNQFIPPFY